MADDLICGVTGASGDFTRAEDNFNELKRLFSRKKKRLRKPRKAKPVRTIKDISTVEGETLDHECSIRGVLESNLWARKICRDHRAIAKDYAETLKHFEDVEPRMYQIGRVYDKLLGSLKTPTIYKQQISSPQEPSFENPDTNCPLESSSAVDTQYTRNYFSLIDE